MTGPFRSRWPSEWWPKACRCVRSKTQFANALGAATPSPTTPTDGGATTPTRGTTLREPGLLELEMLIAEHLATTVQVRKAGTRGTITIQFADLADLERIYYAMMGASSSNTNQ